jgi:hypothetical protein
MAGRVEVQVAIPAGVEVDLSGYPSSAVRVVPLTNWEHIQGQAETHIPNARHAGMQIGTWLPNSVPGTTPPNSPKFGQLCTWGFQGRRFVGSSWNYYAVTAGHCVPEAVICDEDPLRDECVDYESNDPPVIRFDDDSSDWTIDLRQNANEASAWKEDRQMHVRFTTGVDAARIAGNTNQATNCYHTNEYTPNPHPCEWRITGVGVSTTELVGDWRCGSLGNTNDYLCAPILAKNAMGAGSQTTNRVLDLGAAKGDSGSGIKWSTTAWGIAATRMLDSSDLGGTTQSHCLVYVRLDLAENKLGPDGDFQICTTTDCD